MPKALKIAAIALGIASAHAAPAHAWYFYSSGSGCWICNSQNVCDYVHDGNCLASNAVTASSSARLVPPNKAELEKLAAAKFGSEAAKPPVEIKGAGKADKLDKVGGVNKSGKAGADAAAAGAN